LPTTPFKFSPPPPSKHNGLIHSRLLLTLLLLTTCFHLSAQECDCPFGSTVVTLTGSTTIDDLVTNAQLPSGSASGYCITVPANTTLTVDVDYEFQSTLFKMGSNSKISVDISKRLTIGEASVLRGCGALWQGIEVKAQDCLSLGGELDMSSSTLQNAMMGVSTRHNSRIRLVDNTFLNNYVSVGISGYVPSLHPFSPANFSGNTFTADGHYIAPASDLAPSPLVAIRCVKAISFILGSNKTPATYPNTIEKMRRGVDVLNSNGVGIFGLTISNLTGGIYKNTERVGVRVHRSGNVQVAYCAMGDTLIDSLTVRLNYGIYAGDKKVDFYDPMSFNGGKQSYNNNQIGNAYVAGIIVEGLPKVGGDLSINENTVNSDWGRGIDVKNFPSSAGSRLSIVDNKIKQGEVSGYSIWLSKIDVLYKVNQNIITVDDPMIAGITIRESVGRGEVYNNTVTATHVNVNASGWFGIQLLRTENCRVQSNTISGDDFAELESTISTKGISTSLCDNIIYCCNEVNGTTLGVEFSPLLNSDIQFYTTTFKDHDFGLYFHPGSMISAQISTGNDWSTGTRTKDAKFEGVTFGQAMANAPFKVEIVPVTDPTGWFDDGGTDFVCSSGPFSCEDLILPEGFTEITSDDFVALDTAETEIEQVLRFSQQRQLYRKLVENPDLQSWGIDISDFYDDAESSIIDSFDSIDQQWQLLWKTSNGLETAYQPIFDEIQDLNEESDSIQDLYATAGSLLKAAIEARMLDLSDDLLVLHDSLSGFDSLFRIEFDSRLTQLLDDNDHLATTELWETNEKDINELYFRYFSSDLDTFNSGQRTFIHDLAEACPQYDGIGVYKARQIREVYFDSTYSYNDSECIGRRPADQKSPNTVRGFITITPNPANDQTLVTWSDAIDLEVLLTLRDLTGRTLMTQSCSAGMDSYTLNLADIQPGAYWLTLYIEGQVPATGKLNIIR